MTRDGRRDVERVALNFNAKDARSGKCDGYARNISHRQMYAKPQRVTFLDFLVVFVNMFGFKSPSTV